ncbi:MAG TPA: hypothetical protein VHX90_06175 [Verrucomicrobiae bacterium]|jgi:hypothetical protein|nr:hypothetical protein [Verrucomicrobiae bacterium]
MATNTSTPLDSLAILIQAIAHDRQLQKWFSALAGKSAFARRNEILATVGRMTKQGEDSKIISSLFLLTEEKIFATARQILGEHGHIKE